MKNITILGSTGSIGTQALEIVNANADELNVVAMTCGKNIELFINQVKKYKPKKVACLNYEDGVKVKKALQGEKIEVVSGEDGIIECATFEEADMVLVSIVGMAAIAPTVAAIKAGKDIALANKECMVCAGHIIMPLVKEYGVKLIPVDSEHSAIFQSLQAAGDTKPSKIILTCSGGPFRGKTYDELENMTADDALKHPNWSMGKKITIDSATLVNKGLEVMEACWLFNVPLAAIEVVVHPQSILHSAVEFCDGAVVGQMGLPDMKLPISYAFFYPERHLMMSEGLSLTKVGSMTFEEPDMETFIGLPLAFDAMAAGGNVPTAYNAANEWAVSKFLEGKISFTAISELIASAMMENDFIENPTLEEIYKTKELTEKFLESQI